MLKMHEVVCEVDGDACLLCSMAKLSQLYWSSDLLTDEISKSVEELWEVSVLNFWSPPEINVRDHHDCPEFLTSFIMQVIKEWDDWTEQNSIGYVFGDALRFFKI